MTRVEVVSPGPLTTIQDLGRPGWAHIGVPRSGAADRESLQRANRLVGNPAGAAALETTLVGPKLRAESDVVIALAGAPVPARIGTEQIRMDEPVVLAAGELLTVGAADRGLRTYIAFAGGIAAELTLGSAATDLLTGLGPAPLVRGQVIDLGELAGEGRGCSAATAVHSAGTERSPSAETCAQEDPLRLVLGPRQHWFTAEAVVLLSGEAFAVTPESNRIGLRLDGPRLERSVVGELLSEGLVPGAIQVPPDGRPILLLADHPTTGGYPVIAVVREADLPRAAQLRPGQELRFSVG